MSAILSAVSRGFTANTILRKIASNYPKYSNAILGAQAAGYTATQILRKFTNNKTGKNYDEDQFLTEHEKTRKEDDKRKRNRALTTIGVLGTVGVGIAGASYLSGRNAAVQPTQILPALRGGAGQGIQQQTINIPNRQIGYQQRNLPNNPSPAVRQIGAIAPKKSPQAPQSPSPGMPPIAPNMTPANPSGSLRDAMKNQRDPMQSVELVRGLKLEPRFLTAINSGHDAETTSEILKMIIPKEAKQAMEKIPGGIQSIVEDYTKHLQEMKQVEQPNQDIQIPQAAQQEMQPQQVNEQPPIEQQPIEPQQPIQAINELQPQQEKEFEPETQGNRAMLPKGQIGEIESIKNGVAKVNVDGKVKSFKESDLFKEPVGTEQAVRHIIDNIPEGLKSTALQSTMYVNIEGMPLMLTQFYDGKIAWYRDVPENVYEQISLGTYKPKGESITGIGEYNPGVVDSRGAGFHTEIKMNPLYSKENKGKTWGYASNMYSLIHNIQPILHKISKERYDAQGNLIQPQTKPRKKPKA